MKILIILLISCSPCLAQQRCQQCVQRVQVQSVQQVQQAVQSFVLVPSNQVVQPQFSPLPPSLPYSNQTSLSLINVDRLATQALALQQASNSSQGAYHEATLRFLQRLVEIQRPIAEAVARGEAAERVLRAAGLSKEFEAAVAPPSLLQTHCAECHVSETAKGGFALDEQFDSSKAMLMISSQQMPPDDPLTQLQRLDLITELANIQLTSPSSPREKQ